MATCRSIATSKNKPALMYPHHAHSLAGSSAGGVVSVQTQWGIQRQELGLSVNSTPRNRSSEKAACFLSWWVIASSHNIHNRLRTIRQCSHQQDDHWKELNWFCTCSLHNPPWKNTFVYMIQHTVTHHLTGHVLRNVSRWVLLLYKHHRVYLHTLKWGRQWQTYHCGRCSPLLIETL